MSNIICYDPRSINRPGTLLEDAEVARLRASSVGVLPLDRSRYFSGPNAGHALRLFGKDGWRYDGNHSESGCHTLLEITRDTNTLRWFIRVEPIDPARPMSGSFKVIADGSKGGLAGGLRHVERVDSLPRADKHGGVSAYGLSTLAVSIDGFAALYVHGIANNTRVLAFGVSALKE